ncbi:MAG: DUF262 domain-containing protein [Syntrophobacteraceae bacterium]
MTLKDQLADLQKKAKERTVKTQTIEYDLETLVKKIGKSLIKLDPEYQRRHRWDCETSSRLIESLILNIPIPLIYLSQDIDVDEEAEDEIARYSVIDGQQRLNAIKDFLKGKYALEGLTVLNDLNGFKYKRLPPFLIRRLEERTIKCLRIDSTIDSQVKYDIFERLNSGAVKLEAQELRNAVSRGPFNDLIKRLSAHHSFRLMLQIDLDDPEKSKKVRKMEDVELVLRFFALADNYRNVNKGFKLFLNDEMDKFNKCDDKSLKMMEHKFTTTMDFIHDNFGPLAFAKYRSVNGTLKKMSNFNAAVYDALTIAVATGKLNKHAKITLKTKTAYQNLFHDNEFFHSLEGSVNDKNKIIDRINKAKKVISL